MTDIEGEIWSAVLALRWVLGKDMRGAIADANEAVRVFRELVPEGTAIPVRPEDIRQGTSHASDDNAE